MGIIFSIYIQKALYLAYTEAGPCPQTAGLENRSASSYDQSLSPAPTLPFPSSLNSVPSSLLDPRKYIQLTRHFLCLPGLCSIASWFLVGKYGAECYNGRWTGRAEEM